MHENNGAHLLFGGGEMGNLIRDFDWRNTSLGAISDWPISLRAAVNLILQSPVPHQILWGNESISIYNSAYIAFAGPRHPAMLGIPIAESWPETAEITRHIRFTCFQGESITNKRFPYTVFRNNQPEEIWMDFYCSPILNENESVGGVLMTVIETTQYIETEKALKTSEERFSSIINQTGAPIAETDLTGKFVLVNDQFCQLVGYAKEDLYQMRMQEITHPDDRLGNIALFKQAIQDGQPFRIEKRYIRPDGAETWVDNNVALIKDEDNKPLYIVAVSKDINERKKAELEQKRFLALCENSSDFIGFATTEGKPIYINPAGRKMLGLDAQEDISNIDFLDHFTEEDQEFVKEVILPTQWKEGRWVGEFRFRNLKTGQTIPVYYNQFVVKDPDTNEILGIATVSPDITEQKRTEAALKARNEELQRTNNDLDNFIYTASHDLKTPILNIEGLVELLRLDLPAGVLQNKDISTSLHLIKDAISRFRSTIGDLTDLSKLQKQAEDVDQINIAELFDEICLDLAMPIKSSDARLEVNFSQAPVIEFSRKNFRSILYNLASNAIKYQSPDRTPLIQINTKLEADTLILTVQDNGIGVNMAQADKVFMMYKRLHTHVDGNGLGLYIVKKIIENSGGKIILKSELDKGSTFQVFLKTAKNKS